MKEVSYAILGGISFFIGMFVGRNAAVTDLQREAVKVGVAEYALKGAGPDAEFRWKPADAMLKQSEVGR